MMSRNLALEAIGVHKSERLRGDANKMVTEVRNFLK